MFELQWFDPFTGYVGSLDSNLDTTTPKSNLWFFPSQFPQTYTFPGCYLIIRIKGSFLENKSCN